MLTQNRLYFVRVARQTNHIRGTFLSQLNFNFEGFLSTDKSKPYPLNFKSTHLLLILLFIIINSIGLGFALAFGLFYFGLPINIVTSFSFTLLTLTMHAPFDVDSDGNIYTSYIFKYKIHKFSLNGELKKTFPTPRSYIPPPFKSPKSLNTKELEEWFSQWHQLISIFAVKKYVIAVSNSHRPKEYKIDIYDKNGNLIRENIATDLELVGSDSSSNLYFIGRLTETGSFLEIY